MFGIVAMSRRLRVVAEIERRCRQRDGMPITELNVVGAACHHPSRLRRQVRLAEGGLFRLLDNMRTQWEIERQIKKPLLPITGADQGALGLLAYDPARRNSRSHARQDAISR